MMPDYWHWRFCDAVFLETAYQLTLELLRLAGPKTILPGRQEWMASRDYQKLMGIALVNAQVRRELLDRR